MAIRLRRRGSEIAALALVTALGGWVTPANATGMVVLPGYDLFRTMPGTRIGIALPGAPDTVVRFTSEPLGQFTMDGDTVGTGGADTIVRRLDTATPDDGRVRVQLIALQMRSYQPVGYFVTLQSDRGRNPLDPPVGPPSVGFLDIAFDPDGLGGTYESKFVVNYDVRAGAVDGPVVASGSAPIIDHDVWQHARPSEPVGGCHDEAVAIGHCIGVDTDTKQVCSTTTGAPIPPLAGIDTNLNGQNEDGDFHPFTTPSAAEETTVCVGPGGGGSGQGGTAEFDGTAHIDCFACGTSSGTASLSALGVWLNGQPISGPVDATFTAFGSPGTCPVTGTASGSTTGAVNVNFNWTRLGAVAVITTSGDINGFGVATFTVTEPIGVPCGGPVDATVAGVITGT